MRKIVSIGATLVAITLATGARAGGAITIPPPELVPDHLPAYVKIVRVPFWDMHEACTGHKREHKGGSFTEPRVAECANAREIRIPAAGDLSPVETCALLIHGAGHTIYGGQWDHLRAVRYLSGFVNLRFPADYLKPGQAVPSMCGVLTEWGGTK